MLIYPEGILMDRDGCPSCSELQLKLEAWQEKYDKACKQMVEIRVNGERISYPIKQLLTESAVTSDIPGGGK